MAHSRKVGLGKRKTKRWGVVSRMKTLKIGDRVKENPKMPWFGKIGKIGKVTKVGPWWSNVKFPDDLEIYEYHDGELLKEM